MNRGSSFRNRPLDSEQWHLVITPPSSGFRNMAVDEAILLCYNKGLVPPTLRFYSWEPPCLSIGYFQSVVKGIQVESCLKMGIDLVRRPTGGRALLHQDELTYSLVCSSAHPRTGGSVVESYRTISQGILAGLRLLGVDAIALPRRRRGARPNSESCFATVSHYEITVQGRKLVGSAQLRRDGALLQQGSIPFVFDAMVLACLLRQQEGHPLTRQDLSTHSISLNEARAEPSQWQEVAQALKNGFEEALGISLVESSLTEDEEEVARELERTKYATAEWNFRR